MQNATILPWLQDAILLWAKTILGTNLILQQIKFVKTEVLFHKNNFQGYYNFRNV